MREQGNEGKKEREKGAEALGKVASGKKLLREKRHMSEKYYPLVGQSEGGTSMGTYALQRQTNGWLRSLNQLTSRKPASLTIIFRRSTKEKGTALERRVTKEEQRIQLQLTAPFRG